MPQDREGGCATTAAQFAAGWSALQRWPPVPLRPLFAAALSAAFRTPLPAIRLGARLRRGGPGARRLGRPHRRCDLGSRRWRCPFRARSLRRRSRGNPRLRRCCVGRRLGSRGRTRPAALGPLASALGAAILLRHRLLRHRLWRPAAHRRRHLRRCCGGHRRGAGCDHGGGSTRTCWRQDDRRRRARIGDRLRGRRRIAPVATPPIIGRRAHLRRGPRRRPAAEVVVGHSFGRGRTAGLAALRTSRRCRNRGLRHGRPAAAAFGARRRHGLHLEARTAPHVVRARTGRPAEAPLPLGIAGGPERPRLDAAWRRRRRDADRRRLHRDVAAGLVDDRADRWQVARARSARPDRFAIRQHVGRHHGHRVRVLAVRVVALPTAGCRLMRTLRTCV